MNWSWDELLELARGALERGAEAVEHEQGVRGIDALDETEVHPLLAAAFAAAGLGVVREQPFPGGEERLPRRHERERCDIVLLPSPRLTLIDPVAARRAGLELEGTLFSEVLEKAPEGVAPEEAAWIEVKVVGQFACRDGVPGPNRSYSSELTGALRADLAKLGAERRIAWGAAMLVLFVAEREVAEHDVPVALHRCLDRGVTFGVARSAGFAIADRIGNRWCSIWLVPVR